MKPPLQSLLLASDLIKNVESGVKKITIRNSHKDYRPGMVIICNPEDSWCVKRNITEVRHTTAGEVSQQDIEDDGFKNQDDMIQCLSKYYPDINLDSQVTVIRWE